MWDMVHVAYWNIHDYVLAFWSLISGIDPIARYVYAMTNSEKRWWFPDADFAGGGYAGLAQIKIFMKEKYFTLHGVVDIVNHEVLHQVLRSRISSKACHQLDNIQMAFYDKGIIIEFYNPKTSERF